MNMQRESDRMGTAGEILKKEQPSRTIWGGRNKDRFAKSLKAAPEQSKRLSVKKRDYFHQE